MPQQPCRQEKSSILQNWVLGFLETSNQVLKEIKFKFPSLAWLRISMSYHRFTNVREHFQGEYTQQNLFCKMESKGFVANQLFFQSFGSKDITKVTTNFKKSLAQALVGMGYAEDT